MTEELEAGPAGKPATGSEASAPKPSTYAPAAATPTQVGPFGLRFDFNEGARVTLPSRETGVWRVRLSDADTGNTLFETEMRSGFVRSAKRWFVRFLVEVWERETDKAPWRLVFSHGYDAKDREVLIQFPVGTVGDFIAWFAYACRFAERWPGARVTCVMSPPLIELFHDAYPDISFCTRDEAEQRQLNEAAYATYYLGLFFTDKASEWQPIDFRHVGLHKTAGHILGVDLAERPPRLAIPDASRPIAERYAVIAVQASTASKMWNNPAGWRETVRGLKARGYRVVCVDQKPMHGQGLFWNQIPHGCEDLTGMALTETARWLFHADLFVGLSSGLSWLAWAAGCPVVMISGFSWPSTEFETPGRVINWHTCNGCWNDPAFVFDHKEFMWCPRHAGTPRQFECTRLILTAHVSRGLSACWGLRPKPRPKSWPCRRDLVPAPLGSGSHPNPPALVHSVSGPAVRYAMRVAATDLTGRTRLAGKRGDFALLGGLLILTGATGQAVATSVQVIKELAPDFRRATATDGGGDAGILGGNGSSPTGSLTYREQFLNCR